MVSTFWVRMNALFPRGGWEGRGEGKEGWENGGGVIGEPPPFSHATRLKGSRRNGTSHYTGEEIEKEDIYVSKKKGVSK